MLLAMTRSLAAVASILLGTPLALAEDPAPGAYLPLNDFAIPGTGSDVLLNGNLVVEVPSLQIAVDSDEQGLPNGIASELVFAGGVTLEIGADSDGAFDGAIPFGTVPLPVIPIGIDILIQPFALLKAQVSGTAAAGMRASFVQEFELEFQLELGPGVVLNAETPEVIQLSGTPDLTGGSAAEIRVDVTAAMLFLVNFKGVPIGGPYAGAAFGAELSVDPAANPWWEIAGHLEPFLGYTGPIELVQFIPGLSFPVANAGGPLAPIPSTRWSRALEIDEDESVWGIAENAEGLLAIGRSGSSRFFAAQLDEEGVVLDAVRADLVAFGKQDPVGMIGTADGGCILAGNSSGASGARLDRLDGHGAPVWSFGLTHPTASSIGCADLVGLGDGDFAVLGTATSATDGTTAAWIGRFDENGTPIWTRELELAATASDSEGRALTHCANGDLVFAGFLELDEDDGGTPVMSGKNLALARITEAGDLVFLSAAGQVGDQIATCVVEAHSGELVLGTAIADGAEDWAGLVRFDASGAYLGAVAYHGDRDSVVAYDVIDLQPTAGGTFVLGNVDQGPARDAFLALVSDRGVVIWWKTIGGVDLDDPFGLIALQDGLVAHGRTESLDQLGSNTREDAWIVRTDVDGMLHFDDSNGFEATNDQATWFAWGEFSKATTLSPSIVPVTLGMSVTPLQTSATTVLQMELTD